MQQFYKNILTFAIINCILSFVLADNVVSPIKPRQCYSCEGINCQRITKQNVTTTCTDLLDICVTVFEGYTVVSKGCYLDMPDQLRGKCDTNNNPECFKCFGQLCNNKGRTDFKCIECNDNLKCASDTSDMLPVQCSIPTAPNSYCYIRNYAGNRVQRGCYVHAQDQMDCLRDTSCSLCLSNDGIACNSYKVALVQAQSKAAQNVVNFTLFLLTAHWLSEFLR